MGRLSADEEFANDVAYGKESEIVIANYFLNKGYKIELAEDYGIFPYEDENDDETKYRGPRILVYYDYNYKTMEEIEVSGEYLIAPDLRISKEKIRGFIEIKRRGTLNKFNGDEILYLNEKYWNDYVKLEHLCRYSDYGDGLVLYVCVDNFKKEKNAIFYASISHLEENIQYRVKHCVAFNLKVFKRMSV